MGNPILRTLRDAGKYWADRAASQPPAQAALESVHPLYAMGSAMGSMHKYAGEGDIAGAGLAAASAVPMFGAYRAAQAANPFLKGAAGVAAPAEHGLRGLGANLATSGAETVYDQNISVVPVAVAAPTPKPKPRPTNP